MTSNVADSLVIKGCLYYKMKKRIVPNHKFWVEFHRETSNNPRELRFFLSEDKAGKRSAMCESITLLNILEVCHKNQAGKPVFQITSTKYKYHLWTETKEEMTHWINALQQELFGLPIAAITYEFKVMVLDNSTAKKYNLFGHYTAKINDTMFTLFSANGMISTRFSIQISEIWRVKLVPMPNDSAHSGFVVIDVIGGALLLMSDSFTDIARVVSHRRRLVEGRTQSETTGAPFSPPHHGSPAAFRKMKTAPIGIVNHNKSTGYHSPLLQRHYLEYTDSSVDMGSSSPEPKTQLQRSQSIEQENGEMSPPLHVPNGFHTVRKSPKLMITTPPTIKPKPVCRRTDEPSSGKLSLSAARTHSEGTINQYQKTMTISNRPPVPLPRSPQSLRKFFPHHDYSPKDILQELRVKRFNSTSSDSESNDDEGDLQYYIIPNRDSDEQIYMEVFSDEDSHNSEQEEYCYAYEDRKSVYEDEYYIDDEIIELRKKLSRKKYTSLKGSRSMDNITSHIP